MKRLAFFQLEAFYRKGGTVFFYVILILAAIAAISVCYQQSVLVFDDSFISYRYAKNLAENGVLSWNLTGKHAEGFSNLLLVLLLAAGIKFSILPLFLARIISFVSLAAIGYAFSMTLWIAFRIGWKPAVSLFLLFIFSSQVLPLCMIGMETLLSAAFIAFFLLHATRLLQADSQEEKYMQLKRLCVVSFFALLTRRENGLLILPLLFLAVNGRRRSLFVLAVYWLLPVVLYLFWKMYYYGDVFPLPFYVKAVAAHVPKTFWLIQSSGIDAVRSTLLSHKLLFLVAAASIFSCWRQTRERRWCLLLLGIYGLFTCYFCTVDVLMNVFNRFLLPFQLILYLLTGPLISRLNRSLSKEATPEGSHAVIGIACSVALLIVLLPCRGVVVNTMRGIGPTPNEKDLMTRELLFARCLQQYPGLSKVSIAFGDAGVTAYYTGTYFIDITGLNDPVIAKSKRQDAVDYLLNARPVLLIGASANGHWVDFGHGQLGDYRTWIGDSRMDSYRYVATVQTNNYNLEMLVRKDYADFNGLSTWLRKCADTTYANKGMLPFGIRSSCWQ